MRIHFGQGWKGRLGLQVKDNAFGEEDVKVGALESEYESYGTTWRKILAEGLAGMGVGLRT